MNRQTAPVFRKAMRGYKKEDVNAYIINMSKRYNEAEADHKNQISMLRARIEDADNELVKVKNENEEIAVAKDSEIEKLREQLAAVIAELDSTKTELSAKQALVETLTKKIDEAPKCSPSDSFGGVTDPAEKALLFDCISSKTGEIMLIACKTADDIIAQAKREADQIIGEANAKKENMLRSISGSAESVTSDISSYIKVAVDGCLEKIYSSIKSVDSAEKK